MYNFFKIVPLISMTLKIPVYNPKTHYLRVADSAYFRFLSNLRHRIRLATDDYWSVIQKAESVDLFMLTPSISSPSGPSSDSQAIPLTFGGIDTFLVDSAQFGLEPLLMNGFEKVYCYLPSLRGEDFDCRHLNQFYHCEAEMVGTMEDLIPIVEGYVRYLLQEMQKHPNLLEHLAVNQVATVERIKKTINSDFFPRVSFDEAVAVLRKNDRSDLVAESVFGRSFKQNAEVELGALLGCRSPFWIYGYDRDTVPFYQKPNPSNQSKVINADLIFPPILEGSFGGEGVGCGQRQNNSQEMRDSLMRQRISSNPYKWYIHLRTLSNYQTTSGFGLGIERFLAWILGRDNIRDTILYPRLKGIKTVP